jgi:Holliday junction resolvasome RuvABC endonuclease subunit
MNSFLPIVLGVDSGARQLGVSVFRGEELVYCAVVTIKGSDKTETLLKVQKILKELIVAYGISHVALEKVVFVQQHRSMVKIVFEQIRNFLIAQRRPFSEYKPITVRKAICADEKPTKRNTAIMLARRYKELEHNLNAPNLWQKRYHALLFDAVAVGLVCAREIIDSNIDLKKD